VLYALVALSVGSSLKRAEVELGDRGGGARSLDLGEVREERLEEPGAVVLLDLDEEAEDGSTRAVVLSESAEGTYRD
jgi:hypothetical protein